MADKNGKEPVQQPRGTLARGQIHPASQSAFAYVKSIPVAELAMWMEAFSSTAIEGNLLAEICGETLDRIMKGQAVSDRYVLGLAWAIKTMESPPPKPPVVNKPVVTKRKKG